MACNDNKVINSRVAALDNSKIVNIKLADSLGHVTCSIPNRYDTFYQWTNWSDCGKPCAYEEYRFQPKNLRIAKKTGWFWDGDSKDSIDRFTIEHTAYFPFYALKDTSSEFIKEFVKHREQYLLIEKMEPKITSTEIEKINDRYFYIITIDLLDSSKSIFSKRVFGGTSIMGNIIEFQHQLLTKNNDSLCRRFIEDSKKYLRTIHLSNGP